MRMNAPGSPPAHRLPVLTEVVQLNDGLDGAAPVGPLSSAQAPLPVPVPVPVSLVPVIPAAAALTYPAVPLSAFAPVQGSVSEPLSSPAAVPVPIPVPVPVPVPVTVAAALRSTLPAPPLPAPAPQPLVEPTPVTVDIPLSFGPSGSDVPADPPSIFIDGEPAPPEWLKRRPAQAPIDLPLPARAPPSPLPADFSGSWWSRDEGPPMAPPSAPATQAAPATDPVTMRAAPVVSEAAVVRRVLRGLDNQIDLMFDHRLRDAMVPAMARAADSLMADLREQLAVSLQEMVSQAVAIEMARLGAGSDADKL